VPTGAAGVFAGCSGGTIFAALELSGHKFSNKAALLPKKRTE
jgi:hypothetical protein